MTQRAPAVAVLLAVLVGSLFPPAAAAAGPALPDSVAAVGDSITRAASSAGSLGVDAPQNSWSTGSSGSVNSHVLRLQALGASLGSNIHNLAVSGAKMIDLDGQMQRVVAVQPDYVTVLMGGNDLCTDTVTDMTSVANFRSQFAAAMTRVTTGSPTTLVYVVSIPDVYQLWNLFKGNWWARFIWSSADICQSLLASPTSTQTADVARRAAVRQRNVDFNTQLAEVCAAHPQCRFDANAAFRTAFSTSDVSGDYFHPSVAGQAKLASVSWQAGYAWQPPSTNAPPTASFTTSCSALACAFADTSTDADGTIAARSWSFGDGAGASVASPSYTYAAAGSYTVQLTVTDDEGATATTSQAITVSAPAALPMWVGALSETSTSTRNGWTATVTVRADAASGPLSGVTVTGTWSAGSGSTSCLTSVAGTCSLSATLSKKVSSTTFQVIGLSRAGYVYEPAGTQTSIVVNR